ncbi:SET domain-containing protein-lysine N-methyltransferase [Mesorhizobium sp. LNHC209A00]|uniref:SET domain-containing protein-lysine N-methyltransferase n=1 Tax=Mesorhizobium TaxID=68287 RepID=UPI0018DB82A2|nr:SET domain-containing protein-lysine N-methyltransferase [Mesorhizobium sp. LNHC209A00]
MSYPDKGIDFAHKNTRMEVLWLFHIIIYRVFHHVALLRGPSIASGRSALLVKHWATIRAPHHRCSSVRNRSMLSTEKSHKKAGKVLDRSNAIYVKTVPRKGRGVFSNIPFKYGDVIERAPTWGFEEMDAELVERTGLFEYYFVRYDRQQRNDPMSGYVVFGFISIVNHSFTPNTKIVWTDEESGAWASIVAIKDIKAHEEITHRYTNISDYPPNIKFVA